MTDDVKETPVKESEPEEDLEDGEIEDDDDDEDMLMLQQQQEAAVQPPQQQQPPPQLSPVIVDAQLPPPLQPPPAPTTPKADKHNKEGKEDKERTASAEKRKKKQHLTEAEKSVMKLHKMERMEREKRDKYHRRDQIMHPQPMIDPIDDYAVSLEKALAKVLRKDKGLSDEEKEEEVKRGKKRKKKDKHKKAKRNKQESPKNPEDDIEHHRNVDMEMMAMAHHTHPIKSEDDSTDTESSSDKSEVRNKRHNNRDKRGGGGGGGGGGNFNDNNKNRRDRRDRSRDRNNDNKRQNKNMPKRNVGICLYYLQGKCNDDNCQYSHDCVQPLKLELCKFYLLDCCAKGDKCLYMHSDFPCKYYHTGIPCPFGDDCKFAHGGPLAEGVRQILFKHIETAPKEILGNFPRLSRENAHMMITQAQKNLEMRFGKSKDEGGNAPSNKPEHPSAPLFDYGYGDSHGDMHLDHHDAHKGDRCDKKEKRNRPSRWQDPEPEKNKMQQQQQQGQQQQGQGLLPAGFGGLKTGFADQDMRINSNGDIDMRALPTTLHQSIHPTDIVNPNIFTTKPPPILPSNLNLSTLNLQLLQQTAGFGLLNQSMLAQTVTGQSFMSPPPPAATSDSSGQQKNAPVDIEKYKMDAIKSSANKVDKDNKDEDNHNKDVDLRVSMADTDIRDFPPPVDTDIRHLNLNQPQHPDTADEEENALQIVMEDDEEPAKKHDDDDDHDKVEESMYSLPKTQRDLFQRIQQQQKFNAPQNEPADQDDQYQNIDWYSDDEDDNKLTIEHEDDAGAVSEQPPGHIVDSPAEPVESSSSHTTVDKLGDLSKISISAEVTKLLSTIQQHSKPTDPRTKPSSSAAEASESTSRDPRLARLSSTEQEKPEPMTIYEQSSQGGGGGDRVGRADVDLRNFNMPFKSMGNYTPASEIDASISAHPAITWKVYIVEIPKPDYTGLKLSANDAHTSGDPRLRKIFRLSTEEKDSPASPGASPKAVATPAPRIDPRRKKAMEQAAAAEQPLTYAQQLTTLQSSPFYQSLTSNQKLMLNQELASRNDQSGIADPIISAMLANLGLQASAQQAHATPQHTGQALTILNSLTGVAGVQGFAPPSALMGVPAALMANAPPNLGQGLLGPAPPHLQDFQLAFDPRNGLLGTAPNVAFGAQDFAVGNANANVGLVTPVGGGNYNDEFYDQGPNANYQPPNAANNGQQQRDANNSNNRFNANNSGSNSNARDRNNRRGRNNNNNRNRNNYFRRQHNNNRNRNSPS